MSSALDNLPDELMEHILHYVDSPATLLTLKQTCQRLDDFCEAALYRSVIVDEANCDALVRSFEVRPERRMLVHEVHVRFVSDMASGCSLTPLYSAFPRLEVLSVTSMHDRCDDVEEPYEGAGIVKWQTEQNGLAETLFKAGMEMPAEQRIWTHLRLCEFELSAALEREKGY